MNINFRYMTVEEISELLGWSAFISDGILPLSDITYYLYPEISSKVNSNMNDTDYNNRNNIIKELINNNYTNTINEYKKNNLLEHFQKLWKKYNNIFFETLSKYFNVKIDKCIDASFGLIPVCPRNIEELSFNFDSRADDLFFIDTCMHECCHFYFFELCKKIFPNWQYSHFDNPSLLWYLSEISIDAVLNQEQFQKILKHEFKAYSNFYDVVINDECIVDTIKDIFNNNDVVLAIKISLKYLEENKEKFLEKCNGGKSL